jgi:hypothetical protein
MTKSTTQIKDDIERVKLEVDGRIYTVDVLRRIVQPVQAPRLVLVSFQPESLTQEILSVCIQAIQRYTHEPHELWIIDNNSPLKNTNWLLEWPNINVVFNRTEPFPPESRSLPSRKRQIQIYQGYGSYANAVALELAVRLIDPQSHYLMTMHMDTMPCYRGWLSFLLSKFGSKVRGVGVRMDKTRTPEGVLHILGCLLDYQLFRQLGPSFLPQLPQYDVGDLVTVALREAGYTVFACPNTLWEPHLEDKIPSSSPLRHLHVDRSFDDNGHVIFLHLGRGVRKSLGTHKTGTRPEEWIKFAKRHLLS